MKINLNPSTSQMDTFLATGRVANDADVAEHDEHEEHDHGPDHKHAADCRCRQGHVSDIQALQALFSPPAPTHAPGTRVAFNATMRSLLTYANPPKNGSTGYVVRVRQRVASVGTDQVWVKWDDGGFGHYAAENLVPKAPPTRQASQFSMRATDLSSHFVSHTASTLIHKADRDLWAFREEGGQYVVERLFDETGDPLKV